MGVLGVGLLLGLDNMRVAVALSAGGVSRKAAVRLALVFGIAETSMPLLGLVLGRSLRTFIVRWDDIVAAVLLGICAICILVLAQEDVDRPSFEGSRVLFGLPLALSLDNLSAGAGLGVLGVPVLTTALVIGLMSTLMCLFGLGVGALAHRCLGRRARLIGGTALMVFAVLTAFDL